jgi:hypothetical protein
MTGLMWVKVYWAAAGGFSRRQTCRRKKYSM